MFESLWSSLKEQLRNLMGTFQTHQDVIVEKSTYNPKSFGFLSIDHTSEIESLKQKIHEMQAEDIHLRGLNFHRPTSHFSLGLIGSVILALSVFLIYVYINLTNKKNIRAARRPQNI